MTKGFKCFIFLVFWFRKIKNDWRIIWNVELLMMRACRESCKWSSMVSSCKRHNLIVRSWFVDILMNILISQNLSCYFLMMFDVWSFDCKIISHCARNIIKEMNLWLNRIWNNNSFNQFRKLRAWSHWVHKSLLYINIVFWIIKHFQKTIMVVS